MFKYIIFLLAFSLFVITIDSQNITNLELVQTLNKTNGGHFMAVGVLAIVKFNESITYVASGGYDARVKIWEILSNGFLKIKYTFNFESGGHEDNIIDIIDLGRGLVASASYDKSVKIWDLNEGVLMSSFEEHEDKVYFMAKSQDSDIIASGSKDSVINVYKRNVENDRFEFNIKFTGHSNEISALKFVETNLLASGSKDYTIKIWDLDLGLVKFTFDKTNQGHSSWILCLELLENGYLASGSYDTQIKVWDYRLGKLKFNIDRSGDCHIYPIGSILSLENGLIASVSTYDSRICVWDIDTAVLKMKFTQSQGGHTNIIKKMKKLENGNLLTGSMDNSFKVWDLIKKRLVFTGNDIYGGHSDWVTDFIQFDIEMNSFLVTSSFDRTIKVWKINYSN